MGQKRILIVHDELELLEIYADFLEEKNFEVVTASTVDLAIEKLTDQSFDVLLCDFSMPCGGIKRLFEESKVNDISLPPIYVISGHAKEDLIDSLDQKIMGIFPKPVEFAKLISALGG